MEWFLRDDQLLKRSRVSGAIAERGFEYQRSFALYKMVELLTGHGGLVEMRYECAQDVDLMFGGGSQTYIQIKDFRKTPLSWSVMKNILAGFVRDEFDARTLNGVERVTTGLSYQLAGVGLISDERTFQILRNTYVSNNATEIVDTVIEPEEKDRAAYYAAAQSTLSKVVIDLAPRDSPEQAYRLMTEALLVRFGVLPERVSAAVSYLDERLVRQNAVYPHSVAEWISSFVPKDHPASDRSALRVAPISETSTDSGTQKFYSSQSEIWAAISSNLDVPRNAYQEVVNFLESEAALKVVITGPSGSGKSTLARRALWNLQRCGKLFALELVGGENLEEAFQSALLIGQAQASSGRPVVILVDDLFNHRPAVEFTKTLRAKDNVKVLATAWSVKRPELFGDGFRSVPLNKITDQEAKAAAAALKTSLTRLKQNELAQILKEGQFLILNLALLGQGSNTAFGRKILQSLESTAGDRVGGYLDLCAAGLTDTSVPRSVLKARGEKFDLLDADKDFDGLVFRAGNGEQIRSGHRLIAEAVIKAAEIDPVSRLIGLSQAADLHIDRDRRFALRAVERAIEPENRPFAASHLPAIDAVCRRAAELGHYVDCIRATKVARELGLRQTAQFTQLQATADRVITARDAAAFRADMEKAGRSAEAFPTLFHFYDRVDDAWGRRLFVNSIQHMDRDRQIAVLSQSLKWLRSNPSHGQETAAILNSMAWIRPSPAGLSDMIIEVVRAAGPSAAVIQASCKLIESNFGNQSAADAVVRYGIPLVTLPAWVPFGLAGPVVKAANSASERVKSELLDRLLGIYLTHPDGKQNAAFLFEVSAHIAPPERSAMLVEMIDGEQLSFEDADKAKRILSRRLRES
ncbi:MAG: ATP-binding protein [Alphaproteobacteria bacterium]|nr:MAG: ATP-binding protein [Alphaproteobacteria bacterium]